MSLSGDVKGGYLDIDYVGGSSNQTLSTGEGPGEYVFNGWINTKLRNDMPRDFFHGNGHFGRTIAGFSSSLGLVVVVRINRKMWPKVNGIKQGPIMKNIHLLAKAVKPNS